MERFVKGLTDIGQMREENQDNFSWISLDENTYFLIVADGMGGYKGGAEASKLVVENVTSKIKECDLSKLKKSPRLCVSNAIKYGNSKVNEAAKQNPELKNMGSTCVCALILDNQLYTAHIGDSRAYILRNGVIRQLTEDHTVVQELVRAGYVNKEDAAYHPSAGILTQCLGQMEAANPEFYPPFTLQEGDLLLLCSDGLSGMLDDDEIAEIVFNEPFEKAAEVLIELANDAGGFDNITLILYRHGKISENMNYDIQIGKPVYMNYIEPQENNATLPFVKNKESHSSGFTLENNEQMEIPLWLILSLVGFVLVLAIFFMWFFEVF